MSYEEIVGLTCIVVYMGCMLVMSGSLVVIAYYLRRLVKRNDGK